MERYDYRAALYEDIQEYIKENHIDVTCEDVADTLHDDLWTEDSVTGNASGSYFYNTWAAEEALCHNWDLIEEVVTEFGFKFIKTGGRSLRCRNPLLPAWGGNRKGTGGYAQ